MLTYHFPNDKKIPKYEYIYECLKKDILNQTILAHEKLPSKRAFSKHLQISLITIENAYAQLLIEGYIYSIEKKGYFVNEIEYLEAPKRSTQSIEEKRPEEYIIDLKTNSVSPSNFPFSTWSKLTRQILSQQDSSLLIKSPQQGNCDLRDAICQHLHHFSGMNVSPFQIIIGAGTEYLYHLVIQLLGRNLIYGFEDPGHRSISKIYQANGVQYKSIPLDKSGLNVDCLRKSNAQVAHISPAHHYPTGITMPIKRRIEILKWAGDTQNYIIEDDYDSEFRLRGNPIPTLFQTDQNERVIYMNTFSKTLAPSFRISYMVLPNHLVQLFHKRLGFYSCSVSSLEQITLFEFIQKGHFEKHINRMRNHYKIIRDEFLKELNQSPLYQHIKIKEENAGLHFLLSYKKDITDRRILQKAHELGLNIGSLSSFYQDGNTEKVLVINYSGLDLSQISLAIQLLTKLLL